MTTLTPKLAQEVIETANKNYTKNVCISAASLGLSVACGIYYMTLPKAPQQPSYMILSQGEKKDKNANKKFLLQMTAMLLLSVAMGFFFQTYGLYHGPYTQKYLPQLQAIANRA